MDVEDPVGADGVSVSAVILHAGERELAGHLAGAPDEEGEGAGVAAANVDFTAEDEDHLRSGVAFAEDEGSVGTHTFDAVGGQPGVLGFSEAIEDETVRSAAIISDSGVGTGGVVEMR